MGGVLTSSMSSPANFNKVQQQNPYGIGAGSYGQILEEDYALEANEIRGSLLKSQLNL